MVKIFDAFFRERKRSLLGKKASALFELKHAVSRTQHELNEHLDAINENTSEIQATYEVMNDLSSKLDKLTERIENVEMYLQSHTSYSGAKVSFNVKPLSKSEQQVFLVIYALEEEQGYVSHADVSKKLNMPSYLVSEYLARLIEKGVPIVKKYVNGAPYVCINPEFKRLQAMENVLEIDPAQKELMSFHA